ncbi:GntR family transcriptional regulator [Arthrobacter zhangbolii]|uniref:GntR family transcriptional regulator n=1 Tax=Arthrobacter zhangbolii TaxID=2886936 RepID=A0A9X1SB51_9MICC|nr:GntR family transcriptional regulator [Arthrobacter zhangbolii]MCC3274077.1 GntR family transcriptional regulator [Arthrobacter zhangbolii]MCC3295137.1 GntR family transcriptional regulator [Arthrobacter zhangbolii]UON92871.1 GntR family transcriptional regulator [Arthrobacter zhangbolii]
MTGTVGGLDTPLESSSRVDEIVDRLVTAIAIGEYLPGSRLPAERDLAASLQVGRMTVRAAIARLVDQGLLRTQRGRNGGSFVCQEQPPTSSGPAVRRILSSRWEALRDTCEAVSLLQGTVCRAAAVNRTAADIDVLARRLEAFRAAASGLESQQADGQLHLAISAAAHNATLQAVLAEVEGRVSIAAPSHVWGDAAGMRDMEKRSLADHELLVAAIIEQRAADAERIGREHARIDLELLESALDRWV